MAHTPGDAESDSAATPDDAERTVIVPRPASGGDEETTVVVDRKPVVDDPERTLVAPRPKEPQRVKDVANLDSGQRDTPTESIADPQDEQTVHRQPIVNPGIGFHRTRWRDRHRSVRALPRRRAPHQLGSSPSRPLPARVLSGPVSGRNRSVMDSPTPTGIRRLCHTRAHPMAPVRLQARSDRSCRRPCCGVERDWLRWFSELHW